MPTSWTDPGPPDHPPPAATWAATLLPAEDLAPHALAAAKATLTKILTAHQAATGAMPTLHQLFDYLCTPEGS